MRIGGKTEQPTQSNAFVDFEPQHGPANQGCSGPHLPQGPQKFELHVMQHQDIRNGNNFKAWSSFDIKPNTKKIYLQLWIYAFYRVNWANID